MNEEALLKAAEDGNLAAVQAYLDNSVDVNCTDSSGQTPLHFAASSGRLEIVRLLLKTGAAIDVQAIYGFTPMHYAAWLGQLEVVRFLLAKGAAIDLKDEGGETPLHRAASYGRLDVVRLLLEKGAVIDVKTNNGETALHLAASSGHVAIVTTLLNKAKDEDYINATNHAGESALFVAAARGHADIVEALLGVNASTHNVTNEDSSLLHAAAIGGKRNILDHLLAFDLDVAACDKMGQTSLHVAAAKGHASAVLSLLNANANVLATTTAGVTPVTQAIQRGHRRLATILQAAAHSAIPDVLAAKIEMDTSSPLGSGGYGAVYKGTYKGQTVAIKTAANASCGRALLYEMETMQLCDSPYVLQLLAVSGANTSSPKLVLEYMDGGDLRSYLDAKRRGEPTKVDVSSLEVAWVLANALADMHHSGLLHRDLKSQNVLLSSTNYIKLADLGIAREYESNMTTAKGTPYWTAPEVFASDSKYSFAADIYSFGVILTELDTLQLPFHDVKDLGYWSIMDQVRLGTRRPTMSANCPPWLRQLADACLSFDPSLRPSAQMLVTSLQKLIGRSKKELASEPEAEPSNQGIRLTHSTPESLDDANKLQSRTSSTLRDASATTTTSSTASGTSTGSTTYSSWSNSRLVSTRVACQLCRASNSLLESHCEACKGPLASVASKLKVLLKRLAVAKKNGFEIDDGLCDEELPDDQEKLRILLLRIEQATKA
ncbi:TKL protein kinase [Saprolegnia parasitica CBS 223.65]|uniref:TKL protein kinase n=1 Tax=Saprolegnia parasitica (strain CBS 223.65) TaxID=695850 RepID=A0A067BWJ9_SAPPC|nr:TKL protein kinase [Saprolegnia parasitica CBS 223.65]KDO18992.1 TKL protein kinase [Saprolegnia parasitica CBS 223.65]|eukprot:XP_012210309.1 TKL protein kinase [Saprolegnia parasitica CBS 223.65]